MPSVQVRQFIDGAWCGDPVRPALAPARQHEVIAVCCDGDAADVESAVGAAAAAYPAWRHTPAPRRGEFLTRAAGLLEMRSDEVATRVCLEEGKTLAEARAEVGRTVSLLRYYGAMGWHLEGHNLTSETPGAMVYTQPEPLGVIALITPWNFPLAIPIWKLAPALVAGNTAVLKPALAGAGALSLVIEVLAEAGLPPGVLNVVHGEGGVIGSHLTKHDQVKAISFTGSNGVGRRIQQAATAKRVQLEMGGKNVTVLAADYPVGEAVSAVRQAAFGLTGQACTATSRVLVAAERYEEFIESLVSSVRGMRIGDGIDPEVDMGPVVSQDQLNSDISHVCRAIDDGARLAAGGEASGGLFLQPTVLTDVDDSFSIAKDEVFGPVVCISPMRDVDSAIESINSLPYGLTASILTRDLRRAHRFIEAVDTGTVKVNLPTTGNQPNAPFGGWKESSNDLFKEQGAGAVEFFSHTKTVYISHR